MGECSRQRRIVHADMLFPGEEVHIAGSHILHVRDEGCTVGEQRVAVRGGRRGGRRAAGGVDEQARCDARDT